MGWIGVDLDGTLAVYNGWDGGRIGYPIAPMVNRVRGWLREGKEVRIVTARVANPDVEQSEYQRIAIEYWCEEYIGHKLAVTCCKDMGMVELWDDRAIQVAHNAGEPMLEHLRQRLAATVSTITEVLNQVKEVL